MGTSSTILFVLSISGCAWHCTRSVRHRFSEQGWRATERQGSGVDGRTTRPTLSSFIWRVIAPAIFRLAAFPVSRTWDIIIIRSVLRISTIFGPMVIRLTDWGNSSVTLHGQILAILTKPCSFVVCTMETGCKVPACSSFVCDSARTPYEDKSVMC